MARGKRYEGSPADIREDTRGAKKSGQSLKAYERSAADKRQDARGQAKMNARRKK
jgi:hypothetical protein